MTHRAISWISCTAASLGVLLLAASPAQALTLSVTSSADNGSPGTLRDALQQMQSSSDASNTIELQPGLVIELTGALPTISVPLLIDGHGATITHDGGFSDNAFFEVNLPGAEEVAFEDLQIDGDMPGTPYVRADARAIAFIGASAHLRIEQCSFRNMGVFGAEGGAVYAHADTLTVTGSTFSSGEADLGGAIFATELTALAIDDSGFTANEADDMGGALYVDQQGSTATLLEVTASSFSHQQVHNGAASGGAIATAGRVSTTIENSTFYNNEASFSSADIFVSGTTGSAALTINNSTLVGAYTPEPVGDSIGIIHQNATFTIHNSILTIGAPSPNRYKCLLPQGMIPSGSHNLSVPDDLDSCAFSSVANTQLLPLSEIDLSCTDAGVPGWMSPPFQGYGGSDARTCMPLCTSPAIDAADPSTASGTDQRGFGANRARDIGAHESQPGDNPKSGNDPSICSMSCGNGEIEEGEACETGQGECPPLMISEGYSVPQMCNFETCQCEPKWPYE